MKNIGYEAISRAFGMFDNLRGVSLLQIEQSIPDYRKRQTASW